MNFFAHQTIMVNGHKFTIRKVNEDSIIISNGRGTKELGKPDYRFVTIID